MHIIPSLNCSVVLLGARCLSSLSHNPQQLYFEKDEGEHEGSRRKKKGKGRDIAILVSRKVKWIRPKGKKTRYGRKRQDARRGRSLAREQPVKGREEKRARGTRRHGNRSFGRLNNSGSFISSPRSFPSPFPEIWKSLRPLASRGGLGCSAAQRGDGGRRTNRTRARSVGPRVRPVRLTWLRPAPRTRRFPLSPRFLFCSFPSRT